MAYDFSVLKKKIKENEEWLLREFSQIRTGRANPSMLDSIKAESYGSLVPINQIAGISIEDPKTLRITPWDMSVCKAIEKAIITSNAGLSCVVDDKGLRVIFPVLTTESRAQFIKLAKQKVEESKITIRQDRNKVNDELQSKKKEGALSEDEVVRTKNELDKIIKEAGESLESIGRKKEEEISG